MFAKIIRAWGKETPEILYDRNVTPAGTRKHVERGEGGEAGRELKWREEN
jgi:hypothetical protein